NLGQFYLKPLGCNDPEDVAVNPNNGHLFICNGDQIAGPTSRSIVEINNTGTQVFSTTTAQFCKPSMSSPASEIRPAQRPQPSRTWNWRRAAIQMMIRAS